MLRRIEMTRAFRLLSSSELEPWLEPSSELVRLRSLSLKKVIVPERETNPLYKSRDIVRFRGPLIVESVFVRGKLKELSFSFLVSVSYSLFVSVFIKVQKKYSCIKICRKGVYERLMEIGEVTRK